MTSTDPDAVVARHGLEDADEKELLVRAAPLAAALTLGINYLPPKQFRDLAYFMLEGPAAFDAMELGQFIVQRLIRVVRVREGSLLTISELARIVKVNKSTLWRLVKRERLPFRQLGNKKLYNIEDIKSIRFT
jgi:excisionase family DNA binding protein